MKCMKRLLLIAGVLLSGACAGTSEVPSQQLAQSQAAIRAATEVGADSNPQASLHLKMAKDRMTQAEALDKKGEYAAAGALLDEARVDAELALSLTREQQATQHAEQAQQQTQSIQ
jgi:heterodisulfide reductase subunit A-like polyferredoxin